MERFSVSSELWNRNFVSSGSKRNRRRSVRNRPLTTGSGGWQSKVQVTTIVYEYTKLVPIWLLPRNGKTAGGGASKVNVDNLKSVVLVYHLVEDA